MTAADRYPSYRAPQADRQVLCVPPWPNVSQQLTGNRDGLVDCDVQVLGRPLVELARDARTALLSQARSCTKAYTDVAAFNTAEAPIIVTGHQPELVHPGVWLKNFAAAELARDVGGTAVSLVIDNDLCRTPSIRVPTGTVEQPRSIDVPFDRLQEQIPYEERTIVDAQLWQSFGDRVTKAIEPLVPDPLIAEWWPAVVEISQSTPQLAWQFRKHAIVLEQRWGSRILEIPQSEVCDTEPFRQFAMHLLIDCERFRTDYNGALAEYRRIHRLRSAAQPMPDLVEIDGWTETPFWIWSAQEPIRRALFARSSPAGFELSDRQQWHETLPVGADGDADSAITRLAEWRQAGIKLRTRALITTMYARLLLADTFLHGIGGAKYDQVTDVICERFFGTAPPSFVTLSGTLRLPIEHTSVSPAEVRELRQTLRGLRYHPESHLQGVTLAASDRSTIDGHVAEKRRWVQTAKTEENAAEQHARIEAANAALQPFLQPLRRKLEADLTAKVAQTRTNQLLESREFPFCLFPGDYLRDFLLDFSR